MLVLLFVTLMLARGKPPAVVWLKLPATNKLQLAVGVIVGVRVGVEVNVGVGVCVTVGVKVGVNVSVGKDVLVATVGIFKASGVLIARVARNNSTIPSRYDARWIIEGSMPKMGRTMKVKL